VDIEIRPVGMESFDAFMASASLAFADHVDPKEVERERLVFEPDRALAAFDGPDMVGTAIAASFRMSVPGGEVATAGVTGVGVVPTHRRRGVMTGLMRRLLDGIRDRGEPVAALWASEGRIYGRFGFAVGTFMSVLGIDRPYAELDVDTEPRRIRVLDRAGAIAAFAPVYEAARGMRPGMMARNDAWWEYRVRDVEEDDEPGFGKPFFVLSEGPDGPDGYAMYRTKQDWTTGGPNGTLDVIELVSLGPDPEAALWRYCFGVDLMSRVQAWLRPADDPLVHMVADPRRLTRKLRDALWIRLVDVPAALAARRYPGRDRLVIGVRDAVCPWNEDRFELEAGPDGAECRVSTRTPDLVLSATDLSAIYLGGVRLATLWRSGRVPGDEDVILRMDRLFDRRPGPWCPNLF
jgi:predicted acetyltransferase